MVKKQGFKSIEKSIKAFAQYPLTQSNFYSICRAYISLARRRLCKTLGRNATRCRRTHLHLQNRHYRLMLSWHKFQRWNCRSMKPWSRGVTASLSQNVMCSCAFSYKSCSASLNSLKIAKEDETLFYVQVVNYLLPQTRFSDFHKLYTCWHVGICWPCWFLHVG